eukprot:3750685-Amphidinium_carterae.1
MPLLKTVTRKPLKNSCKNPLQAQLQLIRIAARIQRCVDVSAQVHATTFRNVRKASEQGFLVRRHGKKTCAPQSFTSPKDSKRSLLVLLRHWPSRHCVVSTPMGQPCTSAKSPSSSNNGGVTPVTCAKHSGMTHADAATNCARRIWMFLSKFSQGTNKPLQKDNRIRVSRVTRQHNDASQLIRRSYLDS